MHALAEPRRNDLRGRDRLENRSRPVFALSPRTRLPRLPSKLQYRISFDLINWPSGDGSRGVGLSVSGIEGVDIWLASKRSIASNFEEPVALEMVSHSSCVKQWKWRGKRVALELRRTRKLIGLHHGIIITEFLYALSNDLARLSHYLRFTLS